MDVSLFLAKSLGIYMIIMSLSMLLHPENFVSVITGIFHNASIQFVLGINILVMGVLMVVGHNIWDGTWVVVVTIVSWLALIKGIMYITFPKTISSMAHKMMKDRQWLYVRAAISLLLGLYLTWMGFYS